MTSETFEGTWEEIYRYSDVFAGKQVRVTVLPSAQLKPETDRAEWLEFIERTAGSWKGEPPMRDSQRDNQERNWPDKI